MPTAALKDELGDCVFSLLGLCHSLGMDAAGALEQALKKYEARLAARGDPGSGR